MVNRLKKAIILQRITKRKNFRNMEFLVIIKKFQTMFYHLANRVNRLNKKLLEQNKSIPIPD